MAGKPRKRGVEQPTRPAYDLARLAKRPFKAGSALLLVAGIALASYLLYGHWPIQGAGQAPPPTTSVEPLRHVGAQLCSTCHREQARSWQNSHHALAMQPAGERSVLGDFANARFTYAGIISEFFKREGRFFIRTDGADGRLGEYEIRYTLGVDPLQQYLIELPGGRLQALGVAWDARPKQAGGQRWYHLYPGQHIKAGDPLHWTGRDQNWNFMCAGCHTTGLRKNYDLATDTFATSWSEINVACETCHGPGSAHVAWARQPRVAGDATKGLVTRLGRDRGGAWTFASGKAIARWRGDDSPRSEAEVCFGCHAQRRQLVEPAEPGRLFLDNYAPTLIEPNAYHADGQILGEVFEYGSFLQSKMYRAGVTCSDCHEPHGLKLRAAGNALCAKCHLPGVFDRPQHHHHDAGSAAAQCVSCHMPSRTYMGVDQRRDHSFRVPRPDLTLANGMPNACTDCHANRPATWAAKAIARWYGPQQRRLERHFGAAIDAAWGRRESASQLLDRLARDTDVPGFARATAYALLPRSTSSLAAIRSGLADSDALVRAAAVRALAPFSPEQRAQLGAPLLGDAVRAVRIAAAHVLADVPTHLLSSDHLPGREQAIREIIASENAVAERPESHLNLAELYARQGRAADAEGELKTALRLDPRFVPAMINLADLYRAMQRDEEGDPLLEEAMRLAPKLAQPPFARGLQRVRQGRREEALTLLAKAARLQPEVTRFSYVYAIALHETGETARAVAVLQKAHDRVPADPDILVALIRFERERGRMQVAREYAEKLVRLDPGNIAALQLRQELQR